MSFKKNLLAIYATSILLLSNDLTALANSDVNHINPTNTQSISINLEDIHQQEGVSVSGVLTYNELIESIARDNEISLDEARIIVGPTKRATNTYRTFSRQINVTSTYKPTINFYCETSEASGSFRGIIKVLTTSLNRLYNGISKQFAGNIYSNLENGSTIYYRIDGDFFNNGTTIVSTSVNLGIGESKTTTFNLSGSVTLNHYAYIYTTGYVYF